MKILIVGGVAGGAAAAARARRLNEAAEIIIFERGEYVSFANCGLPYYAGGVIDKRDALLVQTARGLEKRFNISVRTRNLVQSINKKGKQVTVKDLNNGKVYSEYYDYLILSPGAEPVIPPFEGVDLPCVYSVRTIPDIDRIKKKLDDGNTKKAAVIGAGFIGIEMAENLRERGIETYLVEKMDQVMPPYDKEMAVIIHRELAANDVRLYLNEEVSEISECGDSCKVVMVSGRNLEVDIVIMAIGVHSEIVLAKEAGLKIGRKGIMTDAHMRTSDKSIFAIGDAAETLDPITGIYRNIPLAGPAAKQALVAANNICGIDDEYSGTLGTSILKVFNLTAGMTGASEKALRNAGMAYQKVYTHPADHVGYYPGATRMSIKLLYSPDTNIVLGVQIVGKNGVDKRIDLFAVAVKKKLTVQDLSELELCYAPPYGTSKDAVNLIGMVALNHRRGITRLIHWEDISKNDLLLDVRTAGEYKKGTVTGAINIPVNELRGHMEGLPKDKRIAVFCYVGIRAHIASRILTQSGYNAVNVSGGHVSFINFRDAYKTKTVLSSGQELTDESFCTGPTGESKDKEIR